MIIVSNTTPLIGLAAIGRFDLLRQLFPDIEGLRHRGFSLSQAVVDATLEQAGE